MGMNKSVSTVEAKKYHSTGVTIISVLLAIGVGLLIIQGIVLLFAKTITVRRAQFEQVIITEDARIHLERMGDSIRNAREWEEEPWLLSAEPYALTIYTNVDADSDAEKLRYYITGGQLVRGVTQNGEEEKTAIIARSIWNVVHEKPLFTYMDANGDVLNSQDIAADTVTRVKITLVVDSNPDRQPQETVIDTLVIPRVAVTQGVADRLWPVTIKLPGGNPPIDAQAEIITVNPETSEETSEFIDIIELNRNRLSSYIGRSYVNINFQSEHVGGYFAGWYAWIGPMLVSHDISQSHYTTDQIPIADICVQAGLDQMLISNDQCPLRQISASGFSRQYKPILTYTQSSGVVDYVYDITFLPAAEPSPTVDLKVNDSDDPISIPYNTAATLSWTTTNATTCTASDSWSGSKAISGSESTGNLTSIATYVLTCENSVGEIAQDTVIVGVEQAYYLANGGYYNDIEVGGDGLPIIAHHSSSGSYTEAEALMVTKCNNVDCSSTQTHHAYDPPGTESGGSFIAMTIGGNGFPIMAHHTQRGLAVTSCGDHECLPGQAVTTIVDPTTHYPERPSVVVGTDGNLVIVSRLYIGQDYGKILVVKCGDQRCTSGNVLTRYPITGRTGDGTKWQSSVEIGSDNLPIIASVVGPESGVLTERIHMMKCGNAACTSISEEAHVDPTVATGGNVVDIDEMDLALSSDGLPIVAIATDPGNFDSDAGWDVRTVKCGTPTCASGNVWGVISTDPSGTRLFYDLVIRTENGLPSISYAKRFIPSDPMVHIYFTQCGNATCTSGNTTSGGQSTSEYHNSHTIANDGLSLQAMQENEEDLSIRKCSLATCISYEWTSRIDFPVNELPQP